MSHYKPLSEIMCIKVISAWSYLQVIRKRSFVNVCPLASHPNAQLYPLASGRDALEFNAPAI